MINIKIKELQKSFINKRFGMFIHFNSATFDFSDPDVDDWDYGWENGGQPSRRIFSPERWNPTELDPAQWARAAKSAGMEFALLTSKHHEGFDLWPSAYTEHCVKNGSIKRDVVREFLDAFRAENVTPGLYFSMLDLQHNINRKKCTSEDKEFIKNQLRELCTNYGEIPFFIFDGWNAFWGGPLYENLPFDEISDFIRSMQPNALIMNISCEVSLDHSDIVLFENAAGQGIPEDFRGPGAACNVLSNHWFWKNTDPDLELKSVDWVLHNIEYMNRQNVVFILNSAPNQLGLMDENSVRRLAEIGKVYKKTQPLAEFPAEWMTK